MDQEMEKLIWKYIDGHMNLTERENIVRHLAKELDWQIKYKELLNIHALLQKEELDMPSLRFTKNVMEEIAKFHIAPATKKYINNKIIFGIAGFFITIILGFVVYAISQVNWSQAGDSKSTFGVNLGNVDYSPMFNNTLMNVFMMLNVVLGLMLLDRYLSLKSKKLMEG